MCSGLIKKVGKGLKLARFVLFVCLFHVLHIATTQTLERIGRVDGQVESQKSSRPSTFWMIQPTVAMQECILAAHM